jgi:hypothetical protein
MRLVHGFSLLSRLGRSGGALLAATLFTATSVQAQSITTIYQGEAAQMGNMFNVTTFGSELFFTAMDINVNVWQGANVLVYIAPGGYQGIENDQGAWTLVSTTALASVNAIDTPTPVALMPFSLAANSVFGFYVTFDGPCCENSLAYTVGNSTYANADLQLDLGLAKGYPFTFTISPRTWNGTLYYDVGTNVVPEPMSLLLLGTGLVGVAVAGRRRRRSQA